MTVKARFVRRLDWRSDAALYALSEPVRYGWEPWGDEPDERPFCDYIIVARIVAKGGEFHS